MPAAIARGDQQAFGFVKANCRHRQPGSLRQFSNGIFNHL